MSKAWAGGSTRRWRRVRKSVLSRDKYRCRLARPRICTGVADSAHHLHGRGSSCAGCRADLPTHLVAACTPCNRAVGDPSRGAPRNAAPMPVTHW